MYSSEMGTNKNKLKNTEAVFGNLNASFGNMLDCLKVSCGTMQINH